MYFFFLTSIGKLAWISEEGSRGKRTGQGINAVRRDDFTRLSGRDLELDRTGIGFVHDRDNRDGGTGVRAGGEMRCSMSSMIDDHVMNLRLVRNYWMDCNGPLREC